MEGGGGGGRGQCGSFPSFPAAAAAAAAPPSSRRSLGLCLRPLRVRLFFISAELWSLGLVSEQVGGFSLVLPVSTRFYCASVLAEAETGAVRREGGAQSRRSSGNFASCRTPLLRLAVSGSGGPVRSALRGRAAVQLSPHVRCTSPRPPSSH